jgi:hypothetical protein
MRALLAILLTLWCGAALAQSGPLPTANRSVSIATGSTYQQIVPIGITVNSLTIQNNNTTSTENCWIELTGNVTNGMTLSSTISALGGITAGKASILLAPGSSYSRFTGHLLWTSGVVATCVTAGDSLYVDSQ